MLFLFMLLSTLINQEVRGGYFKLQKMFILSRAMTISYVAYPSFQRKEKILRNSPGKLIFKAVGGRGEKKTNSTTEPQAHKADHNRRTPQGPWLAPSSPHACCFPWTKGGFPWGRGGLETPCRRQPAAPGARSTEQSRRNQSDFSLENKCCE